MILVALAFMASAPSFDCAKAASNTEKMICADPGLAAADRAMAKLYRGVPRSDRRTRADQNDFLHHKFYRTRCSDEACLVEVYEDRIGELFNAARVKRHDYSSAANHGILSILPVGGGWYAFSAQALWIGSSPGQVNTAEAAGVFKLVNGRAGRAPAGADDCGWKIRRLPNDRWRLHDWQGSAHATCGGVNASVAGVYR
jgi:uncharacterized protein